MPHTLIQSPVTHTLFMSTVTTHTLAELILPCTYTGWHKLALNLIFFFCIIFFFLFTISPSKNYLESLLPGLHFSSVFSPSLSLFFLIAISTTFCLSSQCCEEPSCVDLVLPDYQHPLPKLPNFLHQISTHHVMPRL